jgi:hypothetical protein
MDDAMTTQSRNTTNETAVAAHGPPHGASRPPRAQSAVPAAVLENLATRFRPGGLFLMLLRPDGGIEFQDAAAGLFYQRYVVPLVQYGDPADPDLRDRLVRLNANSNVAVWSALPGILLAAIPCVERRQLAGVMLLAAKAPDFKLSEDVVRVCNRLGIDGIWLGQQAELLPGYGEEALVRQARLLLNIFRDQLRLQSLQSELDSLSGQLANTYEELSLIYQISGGMRINRGANEFFKQACLDVLEVMGVEGMGVGRAWA